MLYRVVRPFPLSLDGLTLILLNAGDEREDFGGMQDGLAAEGYIEPVSVVAEPVKAEEPAAPVAAGADEVVVEVPQVPHRGRKRK